MAEDERSAPGLKQPGCGSIGGLAVRGTINPQCRLSMSKQDTTPCTAPEQQHLCRLLSKAGVPSEPRWYSLILYMRSLEYNDTLSDGQKAAIHELFLDLIRRRDFSDERYDEVARRQEEILTTDYRERLKAALEESSALLEEFGQLFSRRTGEVQNLGEETVQTVQSGMPTEKMVESLRRSFKQLVDAMGQDAIDLHRAANTDALTGLANRRRFDDELQRQCGEERDGPLSLLMLDIDLFKRINDAYGHQIGDQALKLVAHLITQGVKGRADGKCLPARYGGEEFVVIAPGMTLEQAIDMAEHIRASIEKYRFEIKSVDGDVLERNVALTISIGVAQFDEKWEDSHAERLVQGADAALYDAKRSGRNRVSAYEAN